MNTAIVAVLLMTTVMFSATDAKPAPQFMPGMMGMGYPMMGMGMGGSSGEYI